MSPAESAALARGFLADVVRLGELLEDGDLDVAQTLVQRLETDVDVLLRQVSAEQTRRAELEAWAEQVASQVQQLLAQHADVPDQRKPLGA